jgi:xanthine dehydrogenase YagR molybdenum-binding subunit
VKLVLSRRQMFYATGHRPWTMQRVALGAQPDGRLVALIHEGTAETSRHEQHAEALTSLSTHLYTCPNVRTRYRLVPLDESTPNHMRGPGEASGAFALECAMDELAVQMGMDPIELRRRNEPDFDQNRSLPYSSRSLRECYALGAERFGWERRNPLPGSMTDGRWLIGLGMAATTYPANRNAASARARLLADGTAEVEAAASGGPLSVGTLRLSADAGAWRIYDDGFSRIGSPRGVRGASRNRGCDRGEPGAFCEQRHQQAAGISRNCRRAGRAIG